MIIKMMEQKINTPVHNLVDKGFSTLSPSPACPTTTQNNHYMEWLINIPCKAVSIDAVR